MPGAGVILERKRLMPLPESQGAEGNHDGYSLLHGRKKRRDLRGDIENLLHKIREALRKSRS